VTAVYIEATPDETEARLLKGLRRQRIRTRSQDEERRFLEQVKHREDNLSETSCTRSACECGRAL